SSQSRTSPLPIMLALVAAIVFTWRLLGPADLYEKDQPKTLAYTADMVLRGRWTLPRDVLCQPATKPPLFNWLVAPVVKLTGWWSEPLLKWPSLAGVIAIAAMCIFLGRRIEREENLVGVGILAAMIWLANAPVVRLMYLCRPDLLQA